MKLGFLSDKHVIIKRCNANEYVSLNVGVRAITNLPCLNTIKHPVTSIVALYVVTGCDYVSSFCVTKKTIFNIFLQHAKYDDNIFVA